MLKRTSVRILSLSVFLCLPADFSDVDKYLNRADVRKKLGVPKGRKYMRICVSRALRILVACMVHCQSSEYPSRVWRWTTCSSSKFPMAELLTQCSCRWQECNMEINSQFMGV